MTSIKYFPFSPGIPWKIQGFKYILPELPMACLMDVLQQNSAVMAGYGGLLESFFSLSILEMINRISPLTKLFWCGPPNYHYLVKINGLSHFTDLVSAQDLTRFPVPIFLDKEKRVYFNYLNNYQKVKTYWLTKGYKDHRPLVWQLLDKRTIPWDIRDLPKLRYLERPPDLDRYLKTYRLHFNSPYVLLFPDFIYSQHKFDCLRWEELQIKSLAAILRSKNIPLVLVTNNIRKYAYSQARIFPPRLDFIIPLLQNANIILSRTIDFLLVATVLSKADLWAIYHRHEYNVSRNAKKLECTNDIYLRKSLSVMEIVGKIK